MRAVKLHYFVSLRLGGLHAALAIECVHFLTFGVGVVALVLVVLEIGIGNPVEQVADLVFG